jgi:glycine cleavage system H protein
MAKLLFSKTHEWILVDGQKGKLGISDHAQKEMGDLVFIELPRVGDKLSATKPFANVESVKAVSETYSPADGVVTAVNTELETSPEKVNQDAMNAWIAEIEITLLPDGLLTEEEYKALIGK